MGDQAWVTMPCLELAAGTAGCWKSRWTSNWFTA